MKRVRRILAITVIIFAAMQAGIWVNSAFAKSAQLSWTAVTQNCDLSVADDVAGYVILWGDTDGGPYPNEHIVSTPSTSTTVDVGNAEGDRFFVAVTYDIDGNRSDDPEGCGWSTQQTVNFTVGIPQAPNLTAVVGP